MAGLNKEEIVNKAKKIGTYEISIEPYEDCCSFFVPVHPETKADLEVVRQAENRIQFDDMFERALEDSEIDHIKYPEYSKSTSPELEELSD